MDVHLDVSTPPTHKAVTVASPDGVAPVLGPQGQQLYPCLTATTCGTAGLSAGMVVMPPGRFSRPHLHAHTEIVVCCVTGPAVTLVGHDLDPVEHGPGEMIYIPEGVAHVAVNLSTTETLVAIEMRTDPGFNDDVVLLPDLDAGVALAAAAAQARHAAAGSVVRPAFWETCGASGRLPTVA